MWVAHFTTSAYYLVTNTWLLISSPVVFFLIINKDYHV